MYILLDEDDNDQKHFYNQNSIRKKEKKTSCERYDVLLWFRRIMLESEKKLVCLGVKN